MDKEKKVKRFGLVRLGKGDIRDLVIQPEGKYVLHSDWQAERTKRLLVEKQMEDSVKILEAKLTESEKSAQIAYAMYKQNLATANAKIVELEKELETRKISIDEIMSRRVLVEELEEQLSTANKKAEKLVEALEAIKRLSCGKETVGHLAINESRINELAEQALKEFRGGE